MSLKACFIVCALALTASASAFAFNEGDPAVNNATPGQSTRHKRHVVNFDDMSSTADVDNNYFGIQGSLGLANQSSSGINLSTSMLPGMLFGAYYERRFFTYLALRGGVDFTQRGFNNTPANNQSQGYQFSYMEFPVLVKAQYPLGIVTPFITVGPSFGALLGESAFFNGGCNGFNFALNFGGGVDFQVMRHFNIEAGARYSLGLTNVLNTAGQQGLANGAVDNNGNPVLPSIQLSDLQFLAGVSYSL